MNVSKNGPNMVEQIIDPSLDAYPAAFSMAPKSLPSSSANARSPPSAK